MLAQRDVPTSSPTSSARSSAPRSPACAARSPPWATEAPAREVPFAVSLRATTLRGVIDLVVRAPDGLHVIDLKTHALDEPDLARWAGFYAPQIDCYAYAVAAITGEPIAGRHIAVPACGALLSWPAAFDLDVARAELVRLTDLLAAEARGPSRDCARCSATAAWASASCTPAASAPMDRRATRPRGARGRGRRVPTVQAAGRVERDGARMRKTPGVQGLHVLGTGRSGLW